MRESQNKDQKIIKGYCNDGYLLQSSIYITCNIYILYVFDFYTIGDDVFLSIQKHNWL